MHFSFDSFNVIEQSSICMNILDVSMDTKTAELSIVSGLEQAIHFSSKALCGWLLDSIV